MPQKMVLQLLLTIGWSLIGVVLICSSTWIFDRLSPIDYRREIREGNVAAGLVLAAVILGTAAVVATVLSS
jgi:uncharacterized membrane protein YjfL (UPF0719 family)